MGGVDAQVTLVVLACIVASTVFLMEHTHTAVSPPPRAPEQHLAFARDVTPRSPPRPKMKQQQQQQQRQQRQQQLQRLPDHFSDDAAADLTNRTKQPYESCKDNKVFIVHWTHVPKAGGTAFANLAKKVACAKNPALRDVNPCCIEDVCLAEGSCFATASSCPLVMGIGKHASNMDRLHTIPCCGREWYLTTIISFVWYALNAPPTPRDLAALGLHYKNEQKHTLRDVPDGQIDANMGMIARVRTFRRWNMTTRVQFLARTGVDPELLEEKLKLKIFGGTRDHPKLLELMSAARSVAAPVVFGSETRPFPRPGQPTPSALQCAKAAKTIRRGHPSECCDTIGSNSMTMLRSPFQRAVSAYFYRGHSPNYDMFELRPGLWVARPGQQYAQGAPAHLMKHWSFREYLGLDEYRNILTKMFGDSKSCLRQWNCKTCSLTQGCHGYRNASAYLSLRHADEAVLKFEQHAFFGILEAFNASVLLAYHTFGLTTYDPRDFAHTRSATRARSRKCSPVAALAVDASACRFAFESYELDQYVYEKSQRVFCHRLQEAGLAQREDVKEELSRAHLCDPQFDFTNVEHVCGVLETTEMREKLESHRAPCGKKPGWWRKKFGFYG